jgi:two-component system response regulator YesN
MLGVLIVDDEDIICEGLSLLVKSHGYSLLGTASNGKDALAAILEMKPDIVITDIRMPVMDGLELVKTCSGKNIPVNFILLTGYGEFEYAHRAMSFGVKHYILKPADESEILHALDDISCSVMQRENQSMMIENLRRKIRQMAPQAMEEFLAEWIQNGRCAESDLSFFQGLYSQNSAPCRLILMKPENTDDYVIRFELKYISRELLEPLGAYANTTVENIVVIVTELTDQEDLLAQVGKIRENYRKFVGSALAVSISETAEFREIPKLFSEAKQGFLYRFYLEPDAIMRPLSAESSEKGCCPRK